MFTQAEAIRTLLDESAMSLRLIAHAFSDSRSADITTRTAHYANPTTGGAGYDVDGLP
jgi:hypothetical protein